VVRFEASERLNLDFIPPESGVLYSIPTLDPDPTPQLIAAAARRNPASLVYLSTTSVYGSTRDVNELTPVAPRSPAEFARVAAENATLNSGCPALVLRPAAIYGPGRGVHVKMMEGRFRLAGDGSNYVSRIHVEDLAAVASAALLNPVGGAWPVADDHPSRAREIAQFCSDLLGIPLPPGVPPEQLHATRRADRRVRGDAILRILGISLSYPSYHSGIKASVSKNSERKG
jgi:nucleoside-diphosphate-sugar epimerase